MELNGKNAWMVCGQGESWEDQKQDLAAPVAAPGGPGEAQFPLQLAAASPQEAQGPWGKGGFCFTAQHMQTAKGTSTLQCHPS